MVAFYAIGAFLILCIYGYFLDLRNTRLGRCLDCCKPIHTLHDELLTKKHCRCAWKVYPPPYNKKERK